MSESLILYGSRARNEARRASDVDLILAVEGLSLRSPHTVHGVSLHLYSKGWLIEEARTGNLFVYHVAYEGIALHDDGNLLHNLRSSFVKKVSYQKDIEIATNVLRLMLEKNWQDNFDA